LIKGKTKTNMAFVKVVKNRSYFRRFQVKYKRRREAKTDYYARKRLIHQDKNKYATPKYRFVVRFTNRDVVCQIFSADITCGDVCALAAYSHELAAYGITLGLTNYSAAYCTGLLLARRVNAKYKLAYEGNTEVGEDYHIEADGDNNPFKAVLDVGLKRTTTGSRIFGALKGFIDGGVDCPHSDRRFPGSKVENGEATADPAVHRKYILGGHVADYMKSLQEDDEEAYQRQFKRFVEAGITADKLAGLYEKAHKAIRKDPNVARGPLAKGYFGKREKALPKDIKHANKRFHRQKISVQQKIARIQQKLLARGVVPNKTKPY